MILSIIKAAQRKAFAVIELCVVIQPDSWTKQQLSVIRFSRLIIVLREKQIHS